MSKKQPTFTEEQFREVIERVARVPAPGTDERYTADEVAAAARELGADPVVIDRAISTVASASAAASPPVSVSKETALSRVRAGGAGVPTRWLAVVVGGLSMVAILTSRLVSSVILPDVPPDQPLLPPEKALLALAEIMDGSIAKILAMVGLALSGLLFIFSHDETS